ncbi:zinc transporter 6 [Hibiscus syriacus]|uniref:Zinc transporter 6 n=1 Tax=Hibiscus syriacus TaxID=106335 RepID=A0A6A3B0T4_HIBSY|nr:zinc transporter 6 [Hibiscus syriacus]
MPILKKLNNKSPYAQSILKFFTTRFSSSAQYVDPGPFDEPFPDKPTSAYYDEQVLKAGRNGDMATVGYLLNKRIKDGCFNTLKTFSFITNTESSLKNLNPLIEALSRLDKGNTRKYAFDMLIARLCKIRRVEDSLRVVKLIVVKQGSEFRLNAASFHPIVGALAKNKMDEAWKVMDLMRDAGVSPDVTAYNYILTAYCYETKLAEAVAVVKKIEEEGLVADGRTYDALILGACRAGKVEGGLVLLRSMMDAGMHVMYSTHSHVINGLLRLGYYDGTVKFVLACKGKDEMLDKESFGVLANKLVS